MITQGKNIHGFEINQDIQVKHQTTCEFCGKTLTITLSECFNRSGRVCKACIPARRMIERIQERFARISNLADEH